MSTDAPVAVNEQTTGAGLRIRGQKVLLDMDLAQLYGVETSVLVRAVRRNPERFPADFMVQLSKAEFEELKSQSGIARDWGKRRTPPYLFTEQGAAMLSSVLRTQQAAQVNVEIVRTFVQQCGPPATTHELEQRLDTMQQRYDAQFQLVMEAIQRLAQVQEKPRHPMGFRTESTSVE